MAFTIEILEKFSNIIARSGRNKIVYTKIGNVMWEYRRYDAGMLTQIERMKAKNVLNVLSLLSDWNIKIK